MLDGIAYESIALDSKRDDGTQLATLHLTKQNNTIGNLRMHDLMVVCHFWTPN